MRHRSAVPPLPTGLQRVPEEGLTTARPHRRGRSGRLAVRAAVTSLLTLFVVGVPVVSIGHRTQAVEDSSAHAPVDSPVVMGQDGVAPSPPPSPSAEAPPAPAAPSTTAPAPVKTPAAPAPAVPVEEPPATTAEPPAPQATQAAEPADPSLEGQVLALVNTERAAAGCDALVADAGLAAVARAHSANMRDRGYFDHVTPEGLDPVDRAERAGLAARAENIAYGQPDPAAVMTAWMNSAGHRANILDCGLRRLGVGIAEGAGGPWWTQLFG